MSSASTIPYQLRPNKAIERDLFIHLLRGLEKDSNFNFSSYRYVGFGAPFLEDFKKMHNEFSIVNMDCIEYDMAAYSRQIFNSPYRFLSPLPISSTDYITGGYLKEDISQIIWLDFATPSQLGQQLLDLELLAEKLYDGDVLKFTFNANPKAFKDANTLADLKGQTFLDYIRGADEFNLYLPISISPNDIENNFSGLLRTMGKRAIEKGLAKQSRRLIFKPISCFRYSDGQTMTTVAGIISTPGKVETILKTTGLDSWEFFSSEDSSHLLTAHHIDVPSMTMAERLVIDRYLPVEKEKVDDIITNLPFSYKEDKKENRKMIESYLRYYKYLPYFARVTY